MSTARRYGQGWGTQTAAITASGSPLSPPNVGMTTVEEYNGSAWTSGTAVPASAKRYNGAGLGAVKTSGLIFCGDQNPPPLNTTFEWDDSSWTAGGNYPFSGPIGTGSGGGTQTAGIAMGGNSSNTVCNYNGTAWTTTTNFPASKNAVGVAGSQTAAIGFGGSPATTNAFLFDGSTFTATGSLGTSNAGAYGMGGSSPSTTTVGIFASNDATEEFNVSASVITAGAWSSGAALPGVRWNTSGTGTQTAGFVFGGSTGPSPSSFLNTTFEYNGSSWTAGGTNPLTRINQFGAGIQTATIGGGGYYEPGGNTSAANTYDGSSWTGITATPVATKGAGAAGTSTACLIYGSDTPDSSINQDSYYWNGSSWAEEGALNASFQNGAAGGPTENTAFKAGSLQGSPETSTNFETYNGNSWTAGPALITAVQQNRGFGSSTECFSIGGYNKITPVERFNGTAWSTSPSLATGRKQFASANFTAPGVSNGWVGGGADGDSSVEHFTEETTALNVKTLTQS
jgi:hypothetical protein